MWLFVGGGGKNYGAVGGACLGICFVGCLFHLFVKILSASVSMM